MQIHFDIAKHEKWHRKEWESRLESIESRATRASLVDRAADADFTILTRAPQLDDAGFGAHLWGSPSPGKREYVWDDGDQPTGRWPGFYCSLPREAFDSKRHRSFCYPIIYNERIHRFDPEDARFLYGFVGGITSGLRSRLIKYLVAQNKPGEALIKVQGGPWESMFDRSGLDAKLGYAESMRRCRFFVCPRGNGLGSIRLFETMRAGRVPVILSDSFVLPEGINWSACSVRIRESEFHRLPSILRQQEPNWRLMAECARQSWETHYSDDVLLDTIAVHLKAMDICKRVGQLESRWGYCRGLLRLKGRRLLITTRSKVISKLTLVRRK